MTQTNTTTKIQTSTATETLQIVGTISQQCTTNTHTNQCTPVAVVTTVTERGQCTEVVPNRTQQPPCTVTSPAANGNVQRRGQDQANNYPALAGGLGALTVVMALGLVGVILGWAWSCRRRGKSTIQERLVCLLLKDYNNSVM